MTIVKNSKSFIVLTILCIISSCASEESNTVSTECMTDPDNKYAGCWLHEKCTDGKRASGFVFSSTGTVDKQFSAIYDYADCTGTQSGATALITGDNPDEYQFEENFSVADGLPVDKFLYGNQDYDSDASLIAGQDVYRIITKTTYAYYDNDRICFPQDSFMTEVLGVTVNSVPLDRLQNDVEYNELTVPLDLDNCYHRVNASI